MFYIQSYRLGRMARMCILLVCSDVVDFTYFSELYVYCGPGDVLRIITLAIFELAVLLEVLFLLYADQGAASDYFVVSLSFVHMRGEIFLATARFR